MLGDIEKMKDEFRKELDDIKKNFAEKEREYNDRIKHLEDEIARLNNHVRFEVGLNADQNPTQIFPWGYIVPLNNIKIDTNHSFDINEHCYVIPIKGYWSFQGIVSFKNHNLNDTYLHVGINKNGSTIGGIDFYGKTKGHEFMSVNWSCDCNVGDKIYLQVYENALIGAFLTSLSGYLEYPSNE